MAGAYKARSTRGRYSQAGYAGDEERALYIADVPAGSAQDALRDHNRAGYRSERPWHETPEPVFEAAAAVPAHQTAVPRRETAGPQTLLDRLAAQARRERRDVAVCAVLLAVIMMMVAAWGQRMIKGVELQQSINLYQSNTVALERENERLSQKLELARGGERIRNLAQNELGMLRPERAQSETIYIRTSENSAQKTAQNIEEPGMELLDILLGLLNVLHIGE
ncbi:MAG: hypothetical protein ACI4MP_13980 [Candidatus Ventricola sp.]